MSRIHEFVDFPSVCVESCVQRRAEGETEAGRRGTSQDDGGGREDPERGEGERKGEGQERWE